MDALTEVVEVFNDMHSQGTSKKVTIAIDNSDSSCDKPDDADSVDDGTEEAGIAEIGSGDEDNEITDNTDDDWVSKSSCVPT